MATYTENNALAEDTFTNNPLLDFFSNVSGMNLSNQSVLADFCKMLQDSSRFDLIETIKTLFWARDIRGGSGRRDPFRQGFAFLLESASFEQTTETLVKAINKGMIEEIGRWDDLIYLLDLSIEVENDYLTHTIVNHIQNALINGDALAAKWMPRKGKTAAFLASRIFEHVSRHSTRMKLWRKLVVEHTDVVEQKMCSNNWQEIDFNKITGMNHARYANAFSRNCQENWEKFKKSLIKNPEHVKVDALYPHDVIRLMEFSDESEDVLIEAQWEAIKGKMKRMSSNILPIVDVSASMTAEVSGSIQAIHIAAGLGLLAAQTNSGAFKDKLMIFSEDSQIIDISKEFSLREKINKILNSTWSMSTNLQSVFDSLLGFAEMFNVRNEDMPEYILLVSDMEFNMAMNKNRWTDDQVNNIELIKKKYLKSGYDLPKFIFWNVQARKMFPCLEEDGEMFALSGFSSAVLNQILLGAFDNLNTQAFFNSLVSYNPRYEI